MLLETQEDPIAQGRSFLERAIVRFHQRRKYILECVRLCLVIAGDPDHTDDLREGFVQIAHEHLYRSGLPGKSAAPPNEKLVVRCSKAMSDIKSWLQKLAEQAASSVIYQGGQQNAQEIREYTRISLVQQHEVLGMIMCTAIEQGQSTKDDFLTLIQLLKKTEKYDHLLLHLFPSIGAFISRFGSTQFDADVTVAREINKAIFPATDNDSWSLPFFRAAVQAWWLAEYSEFYMEDDLDPALDNIDFDAEEAERKGQFSAALRDGAFDFLLSVVADVKSPDWQDLARTGIRQWLQRKAPPIVQDNVPFSLAFQQQLMREMENFVDGVITNLPDVLRRLRSEEDEQRARVQAQEQELDLERFLMIIAYTYEGRPDVAQQSFWSDPDSNLAGFLQWASMRASTPLVCAFCEMLQSLAEDEESAGSAHSFLLDEGPRSSGQMRRTQSLTWSQILRELDYFSNRLYEIKSQLTSATFRGGRTPGDHLEAEPESSMMLECYLRLVTKLSTNSSTVRQYLTTSASSDIVEILFKLASSAIPDRLMACVFHALRSLLTEKLLETGHAMWTCLDNWLSGTEIAPPASHLRAVAVSSQLRSLPSLETMEATLRQIGNGLEQANAFVAFLTALIAPAQITDNLNDSLPFPENLGAAYRSPGSDLYTDLVLGYIFTTKTSEITDTVQLRLLRLSCVEYCFQALSTFNEDLLVFNNETNIVVDTAIMATDLATYVRLHPFARVMEWMFNDRVVTALYETIHQEGADVGGADPGSPLIQGILRGVQVITKVLELQATYLDLVRPIQKQAPRRGTGLIANPSYGSFEDGLVNHLPLICDLGMYCTIGNPELTMACLKLLEMISASSKLLSAWNPAPGRTVHRNKAIIALEVNGDAEAISRSLVSDLAAPLDLSQREEAPNYLIKLYLLSFLHSCLQASPNKPTIAHLLLGFGCQANSLSVPPNSAFESQTSLFHSIVQLLIEAPSGDEELGMRRWLVELRYKAMRVLHLLWSSPLSAPIVLEELRQNDFVFHLMLREVEIGVELPWDGVPMTSDVFIVSDGAVTLMNFLSLRAMAFGYIASELCSVSQSRLPTLLRRILDALNGQVKDDGSEAIPCPTIFDLFDFVPQEGITMLKPPERKYFAEIDFSVCMEEDAEGTRVYNDRKAADLMALSQNEARNAGAVITNTELQAIKDEEANILLFLRSYNTQLQLSARRLKALRAWTNLLLVMVESQDLKGTAKTSFVLQALQAILPSLEAFASEDTVLALELARLARVLLFKIDLTTPNDGSLVSRKNGNLISDKLYQLFQICLVAIGTWSGSAELRTLYYAICYQYLSALADHQDGSLDSEEVAFSATTSQRALQTVRSAGDRLFSVICDDAYAGGEVACQTAALLLLSAIVDLCRRGGDSPAADVRLSQSMTAATAGAGDDVGSRGGYVVDTLNRLNFIGVMVDSLRTVLDEWQAMSEAAAAAAASRDPVAAAAARQQRHYQEARLALLLQICRTRDGAKHVLHANLFRALEQSGLYAADPELVHLQHQQQVAPGARRGRPLSGVGESTPDLAAIAAHYALLAKTTRLAAAAVVSRGGGYGTGTHPYAQQACRFLADHRLLVAHVLKRSAGMVAGTAEIGVSASSAAAEELRENVEDLADALLVLISATGFLEVSVFGLGIVSS